LGKFKRCDGVALKKIDPVFRLMPHIMPNRYDSEIMFDTEISLEKLERFVLEMRRSGKIKGLKTVHVVAAAMVRTLSQRPRSNRFIMGRRIYARKHISMSLVVKRSLSIDSQEDTITPVFAPSSTLPDIVEKIEERITASIGNDTDAIASTLSKIPNFALALIVDFLKFLDRWGLCPKSIIEASPFHCSFFLTDIGSLGIAPVYHHIPDFGNTTVFIAMGKKETKCELDRDGTVKKKKYLPIRFVLDERVCDGFSNASAVKLFARIMSNPEVLMTPPETVVKDDWL